MPRSISILAGAAVALSITAQAAGAQVLFWSNQAQPIEET